MFDAVHDVQLAMPPGEEAAAHAFFVGVLGIAEDAKIEEFTPHLVRQGHDLVIVAELLGHARLDQTRRYSLTTPEDRQRAINGLLTER